MKITPLDIQHQQFSVRLRGFDVSEVDRFLELVADTFEEVHGENERLKEKVQKTEPQEKEAIKIP
jgi:cell division initiation protein